MSDITDKTAVEIRDLFLNKQASAQEITQAFLDRIGKFDDQIKSFITVSDELAINRAKELDLRLAKGETIETLGKLAAVPIGVKDLINLRGTPTTAGSKMLEGYHSPFNAQISDNILAAGTVPLGKLNLDEFAMGSSNENSAISNVANPWNRKCVPGGSSGGSAACIAAKFAPLAIGTDTGGSIRQPAAYCGIVGMKPTYGRVSRYGIVAFASSLDQAGPMTRNVQDNALLMEALAGHDNKDSTSLPNPVPDYYSELKQGSIKGLRIGVAQEFFTDGLDPEVKSAVNAAIKKYQELGAEIVEIKFDKIKYGLPCYYIIAPAEASSNLARYDGVRYGHRDKGSETLNELYVNSRASFGPEVKRRIMLGVYALSSGYYDAYYKKAQQVRRLLAEDFEQAFKSCDLILSATAPTTAFEIGSKSADPLAMYMSDIMTVPVSLAGLPAISMNCGFDSKGLPIGMQLIAPPLGESKIYQAAYIFEQASDFSKTPDLEKALAAAS